jgi:hypothetical protein
MLITLSLATLGALFSAALLPSKITGAGFRDSQDISELVPTADEADSVYVVLAICRFVLGVGVGGVYPLSASAARSGAPSTSRGGGILPTTTHARSSQHQQAGKCEGKLQSEQHEATNANVSWAFFWQQPGAMSPYVLSYILLNFSKSRTDNASGQTSIYNASKSQGNIEEVGFWSDNTQVLCLAQLACLVCAGCLAQLACLVPKLNSVIRKLNSVYSDHPDARMAISTTLAVPGGARDGSAALRSCAGNYTITFTPALLPSLFMHAQHNRCVRS